MKGDRNPTPAAMVSTGSRQENIAPYNIIFPSRASTGSSARWCPSGVSSSCTSTASSSMSERSADAMAPSGGGSMACAKNSRTSLKQGSRGGGYSLFITPHSRAPSLSRLLL